MLGLTAENGPVFGYLGQLVGLGNVLLKGTLGVCLMIWVRWTLPRLRIDQVMTTCLKYCTPIAAAMFLGATFWHFSFPGKNFFGLLDVPASVYEISEGWDEQSGEPKAENRVAVSEFHGKLGGL